MKWLISFSCHGAGQVWEDSFRVSARSWALIVHVTSWSEMAAGAPAIGFWLQAGSGESIGSLKEGQPDEYAFPKSQIYHCPELSHMATPNCKKGYTLLFRHIFHLLSPVKNLGKRGKMSLRWPLKISAHSQWSISTVRVKEGPTSNTPEFRTKRRIDVLYRYIGALWEVLRHNLWCFVFLMNTWLRFTEMMPL